MYKIIASDGEFSKEEIQLTVIIEQEFNIPMSDRSVLELTESDAINLVRSLDETRKGFIFRILDLMVRADGVIAKGELRAMAEICLSAGIKVP